MAHRACQVERNLERSPLLQPTESSRPRHAHGHLREGTPRAIGSVRRRPRPEPKTRIERDGMWWEWEGGCAGGRPRRLRLRLPPLHAQGKRTRSQAAPTLSFPRFAA
jgi:hypothetical protein